MISSCLSNSLLLAQEAGSSFWTGRQASTTAAAVDDVFRLIVAVIAIFFAIVVCAMVYFVVRYRHREGVPAEKTATHNTALEIVWSVIPLVIVCVIFYQGFMAYMKMVTVPDNAYEIHVTARTWAWSFTYPEKGATSDELHVPVDQDILLLMRSQDFIHSLSIPNFRVKMDCLPNMYTKTWFQAVETGTYDLYCTEYCGASDDGKEGHATMVTKVHVHERTDFERWLEKAADPVGDRPLHVAGEEFFQTNCSQCHNVNGTAATGPPLNGVFGKTHAMSDGEEVTVDENYLRESVRNPGARIASGYESARSMPVFPPATLPEVKLDAIVEYLKTLE
jgi:cytochrome c oxidase subunit 2